MDKITYLNELEQRLHKLPASRVDEIMSLYEQYFFEAEKKGKSAKEIVQTLDSPKKVAKQNYATYAVKKAQHKPDIPHILRALFATIGMSIITLIFVLIPLLFTLLFITIGVLISVGMVLAPIIILVSTAWVGFQYFSLSNLLFGLSYFGLGVTFLVIIAKLLLAIRYLVIRYLTWNINLFKKG
ncbi:DUF1700 domain-containing protein [Staphylococcus canis]|uniref:DUF1700 domain-containing protein n=1 Tax=Staphylococcus canis TaxID=2724942 RepID=A0ABS0T7W9_9STAP|nr:DUF1700 domain-containing protein [Staphylococcus canis]MBI5974772.1 DUF1700 domain-containing protein [Staphylococcus canis]